MECFWRGRGVHAPKRNARARTRVVATGVALDGSWREGLLEPLALCGVLKEQRGVSWWGSARRSWRLDWRVSRGSARALRAGCVATARCGRDSREHRRHGHRRRGHRRRRRLRFGGLCGWVLTGHVWLL